MKSPHCRCGETDPAAFYETNPYQCKPCLKAAYVPQANIEQERTTVNIGLLALNWMGNW